jgi:GNAT superfamily N-acetyltransferase
MNPTLFISKLIYKPSTNKKSEKGSTENIDWIELMAISPQIKCKGIGSKLIQYCIAIAKESSKDAVKLSIKKKNIPAISFYKKASFERSGESKDSFVFNHTCQTQTAEISK